MQEGLNLGKERMVGGDELDSEHIDCKFPVRFTRAQQTAGNVVGRETR